MPDNDYIPSSDLAFCNLLQHVVDTLPQYYDQLAITGATSQVTVLAHDNTVFAYLCSRQTTLRTASEGATSERNRSRYGDKVSPNVVVNLSYPTAPATVPSPNFPGVEKRFRDFVAWLRALPGYDDAIGEALHLVGAQVTTTPSAELQPELSLLIDGGKVQIRWGWGTAARTAKALYIEVDRGTGPQLLVVDTNPNYTDTTTLPATATKWKYRAIWMRDGEMIGQWSPWMEIIVG